MKRNINGWAIARALFYAIFLALLFWFMLSWWDVAANNSNPDTCRELATHQWNLFVRYFGQGPIGPYPYNLFFLSHTSIDNLL